MIRISKIENPTPTVCKWCKTLPPLGSQTYLVEIERTFDKSRFVVCKECLREVKQEAVRALK